MIHGPPSGCVCGGVSWCSHTCCRCRTGARTPNSIVTPSTKNLQIFFWVLVERNFWVSSKIGTTANSSLFPRISQHGGRQKTSFGPTQFTSPQGTLLRDLCDRWFEDYLSIIDGTRQARTSRLEMKVGLTCIFQSNHTKSPYWSFLSALCISKVALF